MGCSLGDKQYISEADCHWLEAFLSLVISLLLGIFAKGSLVTRGPGNLNTAHNASKMSRDSVDLI